MTHREVKLAIRRHAPEGGFFASITGDSLRIGSALSLAAAGASLDEILEAGRWTTPSGQDPAHGAVATLR